MKPLAEEMAQRYGHGETYTRKCQTCEYEQEIQTEGVHILDSGIVKAYTNEDEFHCPKCGDPSGEIADECDDDANSSITDITTGEM